MDRYTRSADPAGGAGSKRSAGRAGAGFVTWCYGIYAWALLALALLLFALLSPFFRGVAGGRRLVRALTRALFRLGRMPIAANGLDRLPEGPHLLLVNHASFLDGIVLTALLPAVPGHAFVVRQQRPQQRVLCPLLERLGAVVLASHAPVRHPVNVKRMEAALRAGRSLVVFPEGGFDSAPGLKPFHSGAFVAAADRGVPIVVAAVRGTRRALPLGRWLPRRVPLTLEIGTVLDTQALATHTVTELVAMARRAMSVLAAEPDA